MELVFMMLILKLPIIYLVGVCWWAIRAEPKPLEPALLPVEAPSRPRPSADRSPGSARGRPHGRRPPRKPSGPRVAVVRAERRA
ncbi:MAG: hypothetical protein ABR583_07565 [Gaiellaceae bacterium]